MYGAAFSGFLDEEWNMDRWDFPASVSSRTAFLKFGSTWRNEEKTRDHHYILRLQRIRFFALRVSDSKVAIQSLLINNFEPVQRPEGTVHLTCHKLSECQRSTVAILENKLRW